MQKASIKIRRDQLEEFKLYLYERENAEATIQKYLTDIRTFFKYLGENLTVDKMRLLEYKEWLVKSYAVNSVNSMLAALNQFLVFLGMDELKVRRIKVQKSLFLQEEKELTVREYKKLFTTALREGNEQLAICMETIASTGIRVSELVFFTVEAVKKECIEITNKGKYRRIFLPKQLKKKTSSVCKKTGHQARSHFYYEKWKTKEPQQHLAGDEESERKSRRRWEKNISTQFTSSVCADLL